MNFEDQEVKEKIIRMAACLVRGELADDTDLDEWGASGPVMAERLAKCITCEHYTVVLGGGRVGADCTVNNKSINEIVPDSWYRCPENKWTEDYDLLGRTFYEDAFEMIRRYDDKVLGEIDDDFEEDDDEDDDDSNNDD